MDTFEPYTIRCMTCGAQLRVEHEDAIGKILSCPKCVSMVQIGPPDVHPETKTDTDVPGATREPVSGTAKTSRDSEREISSTDSTDLISESPAPESQTLPQWILLPLAALAGILLTIGLWSATRPNREQETKASPAKQISDATRPQETLNFLTTDKEKNDPSEVATAATRTATAEPPLIAEPGSPNDKHPAPAKTAQADSLKPNASNETEGSAKTNPLRSKPQVAEKQETPETHPIPEEIAHASNPRIPLPPPAPGLKKKLRTKLQGMQLKEMSLQNAIELLSQLSTIHISLDHAALIRIGLSPETMIQYQGQNNTIDEILGMLLKPLGLVCIPSQESLFITTPDFTDQELFEETYAFDVLETELNAEAIAKIIRAVIAPDSWESAGGESKIIRQNNQLRITQPKAGHSATHRLLAKLTRMRDSPAKNAATRTPDQTTRDPLSEIISYGTRQPLSLAAFLRQLSSRIDPNIVLDELALLRSGISSDQLIEVELKKWPLRDLMKETLTPFGLVSQIMDDHTIIVTSESMPEPSMVLRFYAIPSSDDIDVENLIASIQEQIAPNSWFSRGGDGQFVFEKKFGMLIILQKPDVHREVANYLGDFSVE